MRVSRPMYATLALLTAALLVPAGGANPGNDAVTRSFDDRVMVEFDFKDRGTGIYDPGNAQCPLAVHGLRADVRDTAYYQSGRAATNLKAGVIPATGLGALPPGGLGTCPVPSTSPGNQFVWIEDMNVWLAYDGVSVDQLLCTRADFLDCFPVPGTEHLSAYRCNGATFTAKGDNKHVIGGTGLESLVLSRFANCTGTSNGLVYADSPLTTTACDLFFDRGAWGTDDCLIQTHDHVPYGDGSGYVVSCAAVTVHWFDYTALPPSQGSFEAAAHDYTLVLDLATPTDWAAAKLTHWGATGQIGHVALQGWHDLGGSNGCPATPSGPAYDAEAKKGDDVVSQSQPFIDAATSTLPECSDGVDNDGDGDTDSLEDADCTADVLGIPVPNPLDSDEST